MQGMALLSAVSLWHKGCSGSGGVQPRDDWTCDVSQAVEHMMRCRLENQLSEYAAI